MEKFYTKTPFTIESQQRLNHILLDEPTGSVTKNKNDEITVIQCMNGSQQTRELIKTLTLNGFTVYPEHPNKTKDILSDKKAIDSLYDSLFDKTMTAIEAFEKASFTNDKTQPVIQPSEKEELCNKLINTMKEYGHSLSMPRYIIDKTQNNHTACTYTMQPHEASAVIKAISLAGWKYSLVKDIIASAIMPYNQALRAKKDRPVDILAIIRELTKLENHDIVAQNKNGKLQYHKQLCPITDTLRETAVTKKGFEGFDKLESAIIEAFDIAKLNTANEQQICDEIITTLNYLIWNLDPPTH